MARDRKVLVALILTGLLIGSGNAFAGEEELVMKNTRHGWLVDAGVAEKKQDFKKAIELYRKAMTYPDLQDDAVVGLAQVMIKRGDVREAQMELEHYLNVVNPFNSEARLVLADLMHKSGDESGAIRESAKTVELRPSYETAREKKGQIHFDVKDYESAIREYTTVIKNNPSSFDARMGRTKAFIAKGEVNAAYEDAKYMTDLRPNSVEAKTIMGFVLYEKKDFKGSEESLKSALKSQPDSIDLNEKLGDVSLQLGKQPQAADYYKKCVTIEPYRLDVGIKLGKAYSEMGMKQLAIEEFKRQLALHPGYDASAFHLVKTYLEDNRADFAGATLSKFVETFPAKMWATVAYEKLLISINQVDWAETIAQKSITQNGGKFVEPYLFFAYVQQKKGNVKGALKTLEDAEEMYPTDARVKFNMALVYETLGDVDVAVEKYKEVENSSELGFKAKTNMAWITDKSKTAEEVAKEEPQVNREIAAEVVTRNGKKSGEGIVAEKLNQVHTGTEVYNGIEGTEVKTANARTTVQPYREMELP